MLRTGCLGLIGAAAALFVGCSASGGVDGASTRGSGGIGSGGTDNGDDHAGGAMMGEGSSGSAEQAGSAGAGGGGAGAGGAGGGEVSDAGSGEASSIDPNGGLPGGPASGRLTAHPAGSVMGTTSGYWEYLPPHYGNGALYPLMLFGHGSGENGDGSLAQLQKVLTHGPPKLIKADQWPDARPWVVLAPQHAGSGATNCPSAQQVDDFMTFALAHYEIDPKRVYLTGLSCGGISTWNYLGAHTDERVAAAVPIAGDGRPAFKEAGCQLGKVPVWAFHGLADDQVAPAGSIETIADLKACTNPAAVDARITTYPGVKHDSWTQTYDLSNPANDIYAWMLSHTKP
jgi:poly(3-hydroxybutyrate) depolymerase